MAKSNKNAGGAGSNIGWVLWFVVSLTIAIVLNNMIIISAEVTGTSMGKTLTAKDRVLGLRMAYSSKEPERYDVVIYKDSNDKNAVPSVKRIIGMPGETITIVDGKIQVTKDRVVTVLDEPYASGEIYGNVAYIFVQKESYFLVGDNRDFAAESKEWLIVPRDDIIGKVWLDIYPRIKTIK